MMSSMFRTSGGGDGRTNRSASRAAAAACVITAIAGTAQAQVFQEIVGTPEREIVEALRQTNDRGFVTAGSSQVPGFSRFFITKHKLNGSLDWSRLFGGPGQADFAYDLREALGDQYIIAGRTDALAFANLGLGLLKLDPAGNLIWARVYQGDSAPFDQVNFANTPSVAVVTTGPNAVAGETFAAATSIDSGLIPPSGQYGQLLRVDGAGGAPIFNRAYVDARFQGFSRVSFTDLRYDRSNDTFVISGTTRTRTQPLPGGPAIERAEILFVRTDGAGNVLFARTYALPSGPNGAPINAFGDGIELSSSGEVVIAGHTEFFGPNTPGTIVLRLTGAGAVIWSQAFKDIAPHFRAVHEAPDGTLGVVGTAVSNAASSLAGPMALLTISPGGVPLFERVYGPLTSPDLGKAATPLATPECGWAIAGDKNLSTVIGGQNFLLARTDRLGKTGCFEQAVPPANVFVPMIEQEIPLFPIDLERWESWPGQPGLVPTAVDVLCRGNCACPGDANRDGVVNFADVTSVLVNWLTNYGPGCVGPGDANCDGVVNFADQTTVLVNFGRICP